MPAAALPTLSAIVPNYNHGAYLERCLPAIASQSVPPLELIVLDDASTDNSVEIIKRLAAQYPIIRLVQNEKNLGVMPNLNKGVELARGDYIFICSADDEIQPGLLEKSLSWLARHPQASLSCSSSRWNDTSSGLSYVMAGDMAKAPCYLSPQDLVSLGKAGKFLVVTASVVWRRQPLIDAGRFDPALKWHADWFASFIPALRHGICYTPEPLSHMHLYASSYYHRGRKSEQHRQVLISLLHKLSSAPFADVAPAIRDGATLNLFGLPIIWLLLKHQEFRQFLTPLLVWRCFRRSLELFGQKFLPKPLARLALRLFYHGH
jgi:glycosyltransferase involved in cell wall biosynthesis